MDATLWRARLAKKVAAGQSYVDAADALGPVDNQLRWQLAIRDLIEAMVEDTGAPLVQQRSRRRDAGGQ